MAAKRQSKALSRRVLGGLALAMLSLSHFTARAHGPLHEQITNITQQLTLRPDDTALLLRRGELNRLDERWNDARADFARAQRLKPTSTEPLLGLGRLALDEGKPADAVPFLSRFVARETNHVEGHLLLARALVRSGHAGESVALFDRAVALAAEPRPEWFIERSQAQFAQGGEHTVAALAGLDEGLTRLGPVPTLQLAAIELELQHDGFDAALRRLDAILAVSERKERWLLRRGNILLRAGRAAEARTAFLAARDAFDAVPFRQQRSLAMLDFRRELEARLAALPAAPEPPPATR